MLQGSVSLSITSGARRDVRREQMTLLFKLRREQQSGDGEESAKCNIISFSCPLTIFDAISDLRPSSRSLVDQHEEEGGMYTRTCVCVCVCAFTPTSSEISISYSREVS